MDRGRLPGVLLFDQQQYLAVFDLDRKGLDIFRDRLEDGLYLCVALLAEEVHRVADRRRRGLGGQERQAKPQRPDSGYPHFRKAPRRASATFCGTKCPTWPP